MSEACREAATKSSPLAMQRLETAEARKAVGGSKITNAYDG